MGGVNRLYQDPHNAKSTRVGAFCLSRESGAAFHCVPAGALYFRKISTTGISSFGGGMGRVMVTAPSTFLAVNIPDWL